MKFILSTLVTILASASLAGCVAEEANDSTIEDSASETLDGTSEASESDSITIDMARAPEAGADPSQTDTADGDLEASHGAALSTSTNFYISNPTGGGESYMLRLTPTCSTGATPSTPAITPGTLSGSYTYTKSGSRYYLSYSCQNIGTTKVKVTCSSGTPALSYWFYDC